MTRRQRAWIWIATLCSGVTLYQGVGFTTEYLPLYGGVIGGDRGLSCSRFATNGLSSSVDFCYLLDCENGFFGGIVQPCGDASAATDDYLVDCTTTATTTDPTGATTGGTTP